MNIFGDLTAYNARGASALQWYLGHGEYAEIKCAVLNRGVFPATAAMPEVWFAEK